LDSEELPDAMKMHRALPSREDWGDLSLDPELQYGYEQLGGKRCEEVKPLFASNPTERAAELRFAPPAVFSYYILCFADYLLSPESQGESDAASSFLRLVRERTVEDPSQMADIWSELREAVTTIAERQDFYGAGLDIYGSFLDLRREIEEAYDGYAGMRS
jgi:hypothetical protein